MDKIALYIHWPFCKSKCPYCDFNSHTRDSIDHQEWKNSYLSQLDSYREILQNKQITSIFFGGGTPSLMPPSTVAAIIEQITHSNKLSENCEITLETNPTSFEAEKFSEFKNAGINRVSIGVQSLYDDQLKFLGREHDSTQAIYAIETASKIFDNFSFDLIYARPKQTLKNWEEELLKALSYQPKHLSLYQLTIEKGTKFYTSYQQGEFTLPNETLASELYLLTNQLTSKAGYQAYEISNYAQNGYQSIHNLNYWQYNEYLGIGPGAHSRIIVNGKYTAITMQYNPEKWLKHPIQQSLTLSPKEAANEYLIMGLRIAQGIDLGKLSQILQDNIDQLLNLQAIRKLATQGFLTYNNSSLKITDRGKLVLNHIINQITL